MAKIIPFPSTEETGHSYKSNLMTAGEAWTAKEKKLLDRAEFYESMIAVLDDVRLQNAREQDYGMMEILMEEIPSYQNRLTEIQSQLADLRQRYYNSLRQAN